MKSSLDPAHIRYYEKEIAGYLEKNSRLANSEKIVKMPGINTVTFNPLLSEYEYDLCFSIGSNVVLAQVGTFTGSDSVNAPLWKSALTHIDLKQWEPGLTIENSTDRLLFCVFGHRDNGKRELLDVMPLTPAALFPVIAAAYERRESIDIDYCYDPDFSKKGNLLSKEKKIGMTSLKVWYKAWWKRFNS